MKKRAAIEISISFMIVLIISAIVLGMGIFITHRFFSQGSGMVLTFDERTQQELERALDDGSKVAIPLNSKTIYNGESDTFGVGILHVGGPSNSFTTTISFVKAVDKDGYILCVAGSCSSNPQNWIQTADGSNSIDATILNNEKEKFLVGFEVTGAEPATYIFNVAVTQFDGSGYYGGVLKKIYVEVP